MPLVQRFRREPIWVLDEQINAKIKELSISLGFPTLSHLIYRLYTEVLENQEFHRKLLDERTLQFYLKMSFYADQERQREEQEQRKLNELLLVDANRYNEKIDEKREIEAEVNEEERQEAEQIEKLVERARRNGKTELWLDGLKKKTLDWRQIAQDEISA